LFETTKLITRLRDFKPVTRAIETKSQMETYARLIEWRNLLKNNAGTIWTLEPWTSMALIHNQRDSVFALKASKCQKCGRVQFPEKRVCPNCGAKDQMDEVRLSRFGRVFTYDIDHVFPSPAPPTVMAVVDLEGGGRIFTQMTDCEPEQVHIGMRVELVPRKFHEARGVNHYFFKAKPIPEERYKGNEK